MMEYWKLPDIMFIEVIIFYVTANPLAINLFGFVRIVVIAKYLFNLLK